MVLLAITEVGRADQHVTNPIPSPHLEVVANFYPATAVFKAGNFNIGYSSRITFFKTKISKIENNIGLATVNTLHLRIATGH
jgi:hypothetical protein